MKIVIYLHSRFWITSDVSIYLTSLNVSHFTQQAPDVNLTWDIGHDVIQPITNVHPTSSSDVSGRIDMMSN